MRLFNIVICYHLLLQKETATHSSIFAWRIPWTEKPGRLWSDWSQRIGHNWSDLERTYHLLYVDSSISQAPYGTFIVNSS